MTTIEEVNASAAALAATITQINAKLDEVRAYVVSLQSGNAGATPEQLAGLLAILGGANVEAGEVLAEADSTDGTP